MICRLTILSLSFVSFLFLSCKENKATSINSSQNEIGIRLPNVVTAGRPIVVNLDTCPKPQMISIAERDSFFVNFRTAYWKRKIKIVPPLVRPADFFVTMRKFSNEEGLQAHSVFSSFEDTRGNLWFGTHGGGITRFDGTAAITFTDFDCNDGRAFTEDIQGNVWIGMGGCGLVRYDGRAFTNYTTADGLISNEIRALETDRNGNIWIGTDGKGVARFNGKSFSSITTDSGLVNPWIRSITLDKKGHIWFGTNGGASCYDGKSFRSFTESDGLINNFIRAIACDSRGNLWFATAGGVARYDGEAFTNFTTANGLRSNNIAVVKEDKAGNIWVGTYGGGVSKFDGHRFENFTKEQGLASDFVMTITADKKGNLWFGAEGGGVTCYEGGAVTSYSTDQGLTNDYVTSIAEDRNNNIWFGQRSGGACRYDGKTFTSFGLSQGFAESRVNAIFQDKRSNLWFCTNRGYSSYDGSAFINYDIQHGLLNDEVRCVAEDSFGNLWFGIENGGLVKFNGRTNSIYSTTQGLPSNNVRAIIVEPTGCLWIATFGGGLSRFDGTYFTNFDTSQGLTENRILCMKMDSKGNLWLGTTNHGISILRKEVIAKIKYPQTLNDIVFEKFTTGEGLANNVVYDIVEDQNKNIYIGTNFGLTVIKKGLKEGKKISQDDIEYYNQKTGYAIPDMNGQAMLCDSKGMIWGGTGHDLIRFNYTEVKKSFDKPQLTIRSIKIDNEDPGWYYLMSRRNSDSGSRYMQSAIETEENLFYGLPQAGALRDSLARKFRALEFDSIRKFFPVPINLKLPYKNNDIVIGYGVAEIAKSAMVRYQYMLEGYDKHWGPLTTQLSASFGNIYEGEYTFKVKAISPDGVWSDPVSFSFSVLPPYWRTWWFRLMYITALIGLALVTIWWRLKVFRNNERKKLAHQKELLEMEARALRAQMNPHFIFNCLNSIKALMQKRETEKGITYLTTFSKLIRTLFHNSDKRQISLYDEIETCKLYTQLEAMRLNGKLKYRFHIDPNIDLKSVMVPALIIQPFIENAIWHGIVPKEEGSITVSVKGNDDTVMCEVDDDGIGREMSKLNKPITPAVHESKGVHLSHQRLNLEKSLNDTNSSIEIIDKYENKVASGTKVILSFKLN